MCDVAHGREVSRLEGKVKVKVVKKYRDLALKKIQTVGTEFETSRKRADYLVSQGMVEIVEETKAKGKEQRDEKEKTVQ